MKKQKLSFPTLLQAGCSAILFISCLLPWLNITSPQEFLRGEFSLINMPVQTVSDTGIMTNTFPPVGSIFDYYRIVLYVILFFIFINIFIQLIKKIPLLHVTHVCFQHVSAISFGQEQQTVEIILNVQESAFI